MPLAARQLIKVHLDSARFRMNKIKLAHAAEFHAFRTRAHPSFFSKIFCSYRRSVLQALPNTVDNFTDLRSCIEKLARLIQTDASHQKKRHQYRYQCPFRRRSRHSVCPVFSAHVSYPPINPDKLKTLQAVAMKMATSITENERPTTTQRILASFMMLSGIFTPAPLTISQQ